MPFTPPSLVFAAVAGPLTFGFLVYQGYTCTPPRANAPVINPPTPAQVNALNLISASTVQRETRMGSGVRSLIKYLATVPIIERLDLLFLAVQGVHVLHL